MLTLIATPIGHLGDMSHRAIDALKKSDIILCEDTRTSSVLLNHYGIEKKLYSYHKFNERKNLESILKRLKEGSTIALISDAGTPGINDPGLMLVQACFAESLPVTMVPGPCSPIMALVLSGFDSRRFQYIGFLPKKSYEILRLTMGYPGTTIALESPERLLETLTAITKLDPQRQVAIAREMTKVYEECIRGSAREVLNHFQKKGVRGEICLMIAEGTLPIEEMPLEELILQLQQVHGLSLKEAIKCSAKLLKRPKREIYKKTHC